MYTPAQSFKRTFLRLKGLGKLKFDFFKVGQFANMQIKFGIQEDCQGCRANFRRLEKGKIVWRTDRHFQFMLLPLLSRESWLSFAQPKNLKLHRNPALT